MGHFGEDEVRLFAAELGSALGFLHDLGIMHRDVKMENILLSDQGHLRLSDFGLSRRLKRGGQAFTICGTIHYMGTLSLVLTQLRIPVNRLRNLECFQMQPFFRGTSFDSQILQKTPVEFILKLRSHPDWAAKAMRGLSLDYFDNFDCEKILHSPRNSRCSNSHFS
uniref:Ribosomal protein S6 kinase related n=1 Tax=Lates calcarifer TaxID=8187 RepID=A0A4W6DL15_LATCA